MTPFQRIIQEYRTTAFSEANKGQRFERLIQAFLLTDPTYAPQLETVWLWNEFPFRKELGGQDTGIDLVAKTISGDYWAVQCKFYAEQTQIDKPDVDTFLATSSRTFRDDYFREQSFARRLWVSTTSKWSSNAEESIKNQQPAVTRIHLYDLEQAQVDWQKIADGISGMSARKDKKPIFPHVLEVVRSCHTYFQSHERGKLIMACGTGKTITSLKIAEHETNHRGFVLFLVPSIALINQSLKEWCYQSKEPINAVCICSDAEASKAKKAKSNNQEDVLTQSVVDLAAPASTNVPSIIRQLQTFRQSANQGMTVVFSTYQSIEVIAQTQQELLKSDPTAIFDLIICDEAHRTTGVTLSGEDESAFVKVHDGSYLQSKRRLYMTATPRLYGSDAKSKAAQYDAELCSMDDTTLYGEEIYRIGFGEAVQKGLLTDYKVLVLTLSDKDVPPAILRMISDADNEVNTDDASKLIGCISALSKKMLGDHSNLRETDPDLMRRAVAFCPRIQDSKKISEAFNQIGKDYIHSLPLEGQDSMVRVHAQHIDGTMDTSKREELLSWLKESGDTNDCRVLTNVRCLSEGVDVPSLDAVMFLSPRNSQIDVVQSVGRVMRRAPNKKYGYIIIPVVVPSDTKPEDALNDNERFKVVWTVLNALRAHDDRFNATVNKIELNIHKPTNILIGTPEYTFDDGGAPQAVREPETAYTAQTIQNQLVMQFEQLKGLIYARMVEKVGDKRYWEQWAKNVADIAERHVARIKRLIQDKGKHASAFEGFLDGLRKNINPSIDEQDAIEMLSQHLITKPVFDALFEGYSFVAHNAVSRSMQAMLDLLEEQSMEKDAESLNKFYESVKMRAAGIDNAEGKQRIIIELYDKFFKTAFPKMVEQLGIVYTPVEVVDFIIHSVNDILHKEFGRSISDENIHILDPFTGTGTFIVRLLQSGLIKLEDLERKYKHELHANEIVLLAYYIAAINIENAYHDQTPDPDDGIGKARYTPFEGIVLTDTFQLGETEAPEQLSSEMFPQTSERVINQKTAPLRVIIGNPPYSVGQKSANDNAQNQKYPQLDQRIANTYAQATNATNKNSLYDSYIKAFRWSTDRLGKDGGIICFVSNGAWIDGNAQDGFRKTLQEEFSAIYVFNLRGNARTSGELRQKEAGNVFGSGSRTPIAITLLVKKPEEN